MTENNKDSKSNLSGIGGWLSFLIFSLMFLGPFIGGAHLIGQFQSVLQARPELAENSKWLSFESASWFLFWITTTIGVIAGYRLRKIHNPKSVTFAVITLWGIGPIADVVSLIIAYVVLNLSISAAFPPQVIGKILGSSLISGGWSLYLMRSKRVENTYGTKRSSNTR